MSIKSLRCSSVLLQLLFSISCFSQSWSRIRCLFDESQYYRLFDAKFVEDRGVVAGSSGQLVRTNDFFNSHSVDSAFFTTSFTSLSFSDNDTGYIGAVGVPGGFIKTVDGGALFTCDSTLPQGPLLGNRLYFKNGLQGLVASTNNPYMYMTIDGGVSWNSINYFSTTNCEGVFRFQFLSPDTGFMHGNLTFIESRMCKTTDGGYTWQPVVPNIPVVGDGDFLMLNSSTALIVTDNLV